MKFNMLMCYCIGKAAKSVKEFYLLPVGNKLIQYDNIAVNTIVANKENEVSVMFLSLMIYAYSINIICSLQNKLQRVALTMI